MTEHEHSRSSGPGRHRHFAAPEQVAHGFDEGLRSMPRRPEAEHEGHFSWGQEQLPKTRTEENRGRFSSGLEGPPDVAKDRERRFSQGQEADSNSS
jgi:hypothetical protein